MPSDDQPGATHSALSGSAGDVVQARDIAGGVHFYGAGAGPTHVPAQLPADVRGFVNRTADLGRMDTILGRDVDEEGSASVCVIAGTAGVGKTSIAVRWAHRSRHRFPDGQLYVNLRGYDPGEPISAAQALERFLTSLGVPAAAVPDNLEDRSALFRTLLANRRILVVLDNAATVRQVRPLLPGAGRCLALVTSRSRLSGLVTRDGAHRVTLEVFEEPEAVELLKTTVADYRSGDAELEIAELARLCARLPLALRIAAERAAARPRMPLSELIGNLRDESHLWDALSVEDDEEADAVRTVFAWSYRALPQDAARMFRLLGLHPGPDFSVHAAAALAQTAVDEARRSLDTLVGAHLLGQTSANRYQFHDLLRAYAHDQARHQSTEDEQQGALRRVLLWYLHTADACRLGIGVSRLTLAPVPLVHPDADMHRPDISGPSEATEWFREERGNLVSAVNAASETQHDQLAWQIPAVLRGVYAGLNLFDDWFATSHRGLQAARRQADSQGEAFLLESLLMASRQRFRLDDAARYGESLMEIQVRSGDLYGEAQANRFLALVCTERHRLAQAREYFTRATTLCRENRFDALLSLALLDTAWACSEGGEFESAYDLCAQSISTAQHHEARADRADIELQLAYATNGLGRDEESAHHAQQALDVARGIGSASLEAMGLIYYARAQRALGEPSSALESYHRAASIGRTLGRLKYEAMAVDGAGIAYRDLGRPEEAAAFHRQAIALFREIGDTWLQAVALTNLADAVEGMDAAAEQPASARREALVLLTGFDDMAARTLRSSIEASLPADT